MNKSIPITILVVCHFITTYVFAGIETTDNNSNDFLDITDPVIGPVCLDDPNGTGLPYRLEGVVYVSGKLKIPAGTVIYGAPDVIVGGNITRMPGTLVITKTGKIEAVGTPAQPIIFTYQGDPSPHLIPTPPLTGDVLNAGLWGGVILLGDAPINNDESATNLLLDPGEDFIEGIPEPDPSQGPPDLRGKYGGNNPKHDGGTMRYVSIRHGGFVLSPANEINGLTMGGVGKRTTIEYIEVVACLDDGFQWFGGNVGCKYLLSAYNSDDAFDYDQGFTGNGQFWAAVMADNGVDGDKGGEFDGDDQPGSRPYSVPLIYNMTVLGTGRAGAGFGNGGGQIDFDNNAGGFLYNSIFVGSAIPSLDINVLSSQNVDRLLDVRNNIWFRDPILLGSDSYADHGAGSADLVLYPTNGKGNTFSNPLLGDGTGFNFFTYLTKTYAVGSIYWKPLAVVGYNSVSQNLEPYTGDPFFTSVNYKGAFDPTPNVAPWTDDWTVGSKLDYFSD